MGNKFDTCHNFINAVIKVQQGKEETLIPEEAETIAKWKIGTPEPNALDAGPQASGLSDFDRLNLESQQKNKVRAQSNIVDSKYDPALKYCVLLSQICRQHATCRRHMSMSPNLGRHYVSLRHRRETRMPNLYQLQPTSPNQPKRTGTLVTIHFLCLSSKELPTCNDMSAKADIVVSFWTPCRHDIFLCLRHDQQRGQQN